VTPPYYSIGRFIDDHGKPYNTIELTVDDTILSLNIQTAVELTKALITALKEIKHEKDAKEAK
jgi:hypothetical protein